MGRPRRSSSNSSAEAASDSQHRYRNESSVLKPVTPGQPDDEWPVIVLNDAIILSRDGKPANPLHIDLEGPFKVRGKLEIEKKQQSLLTKPSQKDQYVEIPATFQYSIGYGIVVQEDPEIIHPGVALYMSGASGWFEIRPGPKYKAMYDEVSKAVTLYYEIMGAYEEHEEKFEEQRQRLGKRARRQPPDMDEIFFQYALAIGDGCFRHEVEERCHKWAIFLISHFPKESSFSWKNNEFAKWIKNTHPDIVKKLDDAAAALKQLPPPPKAEETTSAGKGTSESPKGRATRNSRRSIESESSEDVEMMDAPLLSQPRQMQTVERPKLKANSPKAGSTRPPHLPAPMPTKSHSSPIPEDSLSPVDTLIRVLEEIREDMGDIRNKKPSHVYNKLYFKCKVGAYAHCIDIVTYFASDLVDQLRAPWRDTQFYDFLKTKSKEKQRTWDQDWVRSLPHQLTRRAGSQGKSKSGQSAPANHKQPTSFGGAELDSDGEQRYPKPGRPSGKGATLRLKRPASELEDGSTGDSVRGRKSAKRSHTADNEDGNLDEDSDAVAEDDDEMDGNEEHKVVPPKDAVRIVVHAEKIPTVSPSGPNGTWVCEQEGCSYIVRNAETKGVDEIQKHFNDHAAQAERINLAQAEGLRGHAPINHLLEKIQAMGKKALLAENPARHDGPPPLQPIKRRLLV